MAYRRRTTKRKTYGSGRKTRKSSRSYAPKGRVAKRGKTKKRASPRQQTIRVVFVQQPASPTLATPAAKAAPARARF